jgi:hypothetical protein
MEVAERLAIHIKEHKIQLATLADRSGINEATLKGILDGTHQADCIEYHNICKALRVPLKTFIE